MDKIFYIEISVFADEWRWYNMDNLTDIIY